MKENLKINWFEKLKEEKLNWEGIYHLILLPTYKEPFEVIQSSLQSIAEANYPKEKIFVVLALEERGGKDDLENGMKIKNIYEKVFGDFLITLHPSNLPNELPGKGSNETYAIKEAIQKIIKKRNISYEKVLVSSFDVDTKVEKDYFAILTYKFLKEDDNLHASYQPIPVFINNINKTNIFSRLTAFSSTFWQLMQSSRPEQMVSFSSHSIPLKALVDVGFWETNLVSEDSRIFFQCLNYYNGNWKTVPLFYPLYMDAVSGKNFLENMKNLYKQQRRWAWGVENFVYLVRDFKKNKKIPFFKKLYWLLTMFNGFYSWAISSFIILIYGILPNIIGNANFRQSVLSYNLPRYSGIIINLSTLGLIVSAIFALILISHKIKNIKKTKYFFYFLEWFLMPINFIIFGSLPALEAQTRMMLGGKARLGYWRTPKY
jgi:hypothetical protein